MDHPERTRIPPLRKFMLGQSLPHRMRSRPFCLNTSRNNKAGRQVDMRPCPQLLRAGLNSGPTDRKDWSIVVVSKLLPTLAAARPSSPIRIKGALAPPSCNCASPPPILLGLPLYGGRLGFLNLNQSGKRPDRTLSRQHIMVDLPLTLRALGIPRQLTLIVMRRDRCLQ